MEESVEPEIYFGTQIQIIGNNALAAISSVAG
jgi:hypothetical protein